MAIPMRVTVFGYNRLCKQFINTLFNANYYSDPEYHCTIAKNNIKLILCSNGLKYPKSWNDKVYNDLEEKKKILTCQKHITSELIKNTDVFISFTNYLYENEIIMALCNMYNVKFIYVGNIGSLSIIYSNSDNLFSTEQKLLHVYHLAINKFIKKYKIKPYHEKYTNLILWFSNKYYNELFDRHLTIDEYWKINNYCSNQKKCSYLMYYTIYNLYFKLFNNKSKKKIMTMYNYYDYDPSKFINKPELVLQYDFGMNIDKNFKKYIDKYASVTYDKQQAAAIYNKTSDTYYDFGTGYMPYKTFLQIISNNTLEYYDEGLAMYGFSTNSITSYIDDKACVINDYVNYFFEMLNLVINTYNKYRDFNFNKQKLIYYRKSDDNIFLKFDDTKKNDTNVEHVLFSGFFIFNYNVCSNTECVRIAYLLWKELFINDINTYNKIRHRYNCNPLLFEINDLNIEFIYNLSNIWAYIFKLDNITKDQVIDIVTGYDQSNVYNISKYGKYTDYSILLSYNDNNKKNIELFENIFDIKFDIQNIDNISMEFIDDLKVTMTKIYEKIFKTTVIYENTDNFGIFTIIDKLVNNYM